MKLSSATLVALSVIGLNKTGAQRVGEKVGIFDGEGQEETVVHKPKFLRDRDLKVMEIDQSLNKFVVNTTARLTDLGIVNPLIVNGEEVNPRRKYGFFVSIAGGCGASLVAPNVILSAAHCAGLTGPATLGLHMNTVDGVEEFENIETIDFAASVTHPQYSGSTLNNDYWVIQLAHDSQLYQDYITELDSPSDNFELTTGQDVTVIGMGATSSGGGGPNVLQEVTVDYITNAECCSGSYEYSCDQITDNMMCAARPGQDACQGDSGGPIFDTATQKQVGIVSWGYGCADSRYPGVYSRVSAQYDWIKTQIDNYTSGGTNPPAPMVPGQCYNSPKYWYDSQGPQSSCDSYLICSNSFANGGLTSNDACCDCGGGEFYLPPGYTLSPTLSPTSAPTILCLEKKLTVAVVTDNYPDDISWTLGNVCTGEVQTSRDSSSYSKPGDTTEYCVPEAQYDFIINDSFGDGICCDWGEGSYLVEYDGDEVASGGDYGYGETTRFGSCDTPPPTPLPTPSPTPPTTLECKIEMMKGNYNLKADVYGHDQGNYYNLFKANLRVKKPNGGKGRKGVMKFEMCVLEGKNSKDSYLESMVAVTTGFSRDSIITVLIGTSYTGEYNCETEELMIGTSNSTAGVAYSLNQPAVKKDGNVGFPGNC